MDNFKFDVRYTEFRKVNMFFDIHIDLQYNDKIIPITIRYMEDPSSLGTIGYRTLVSIQVSHSRISDEMGFSDPALMTYLRQLLDYYFQPEFLGEGVINALAKLILTRLKTVLKENKIYIPL